MCVDGLNWGLRRRIYLQNKVLVCRMFRLISKYARRDYKGNDDVVTPGGTNEALCWHTPYIEYPDAIERPTSNYLLVWRKMLGLRQLFRRFRPFGRSGPTQSVSNLISRGNITWHMHSC